MQKRWLKICKGKIVRKIDPTPHSADMDATKGATSNRLGNPDPSTPTASYRLDL